MKASRPITAHKVTRIVLSLAVSSTLVMAAAARANDEWLQWGGPGCTFKADTDNLAKKWPEDGPKKLWARDLGDGYSSILCDGKRLYTMYWLPDAPGSSDAGGSDQTGESKGGTKEDESEKADAEKAARRKGSEVVVALDAATGKTVWEYKYPAPWADNMDVTFGPGPNSTPLIVGDRIFTIGATVKLHCLDKNTGEKIWAHDLVEEYKAETMMYGYGASPMPYKDTILLPVGGEGQGVIAFRQSDGSVAWKAQDFKSSWATPLIINVDGEDQVVVMMEKGIAGLDPNSGELKWKQDGHEGACICTPVWGDDNILVTSGAYGVGAHGIKLTREDGKTVAEELWFNKKMQIMHGNGVRVGDVVYGSSGDFGPVFFSAVNVKTGEFLWRKRGFSKATCVYGDKKLIILDEDGNLALTSPKSKKLIIRSKFPLCKRNAWTVPTLIGAKLYVRDRHRIMALDLSEAAN
ncbi:MAG: PQQ-binding-like beta-propeller repeat protein [Planctomycetota bacterium]